MQVARKILFCEQYVQRGVEAALLPEEEPRWPSLGFKTNPRHTFSPQLNRHWWSLFRQGRCMYAIPLLFLSCLRQSMPSPNFHLSSPCQPPPHLWSVVGRRIRPNEVCSWGLRVGHGCRGPGPQPPEALGLPPVGTGLHATSKPRAARPLAETEAKERAARREGWGVGSD